jgi:Uma2 family endonuclease
MSTAAYAQHTEWETLLRTWRALDVPEGWRAEIFDGGIHLAPSPGLDHHEIAFLIHRALARELPDDWRIYQSSAATIETIKRLHEPDVLVIPRSAVAAGGLTVSAADALLAVEITSPSNAHHDRKLKLWSYAHAPIPLYLHIDRFDPAGPQSTLYSEPVDGTYRQDVRVPFGQPILLPEPFGIELATAEFPT